MSNFQLFFFQMTTLALSAILIIVFLFPEKLVSFSAPPPEATATEPEKEKESIIIAQQALSYANAVRRANGAVVNIFTIQPDADPDNSQHTASPDSPTPGRDNLGSGVIMNSSGYIITSNHVIAEATSIKVSLQSGERLDATLVGRDIDTDIAVLKIDREDTPAAEIPEESKIEVGDIVLAIGNPFGFSQTVTQGIVSAEGRQQLGLNTYEDFIQTDAAINPGNSGGALINAQGEVVGINTAIYSGNGGSQGIGFAIPIQLAANVMNQIITHKRVIRGWLGFDGTSVPEEIASKYELADNEGALLTDGVLITDVRNEGPAHAAGLQKNDVILQIDDTLITDVRSALNIIARTRPGETLKIIGNRNGLNFQTQATTGLRPSNLGQPKEVSVSTSAIQQSISN